MKAEKKFLTTYLFFAIYQGWVFLYWDNSLNHRDMIFWSIIWLSHERLSKRNDIYVRLPPLLVKNPQFLQIIVNHSSYDLPLFTYPIYIIWEQNDESLYYYYDYTPPRHIIFIRGSNICQIIFTISALHSRERRRRRPAKKRECEGYNLQTDMSYNDAATAATYITSYISFITTCIAYIRLL